MKDYIWLIDKESGEPALFKVEAIDAVYVRQDKVEDFSFNHPGGQSERNVPTSEPETRVLLRTGSYLSVKETPVRVHMLMRGDRSINDV